LKRFFLPDKLYQIEYKERTPEDYLNAISPDILASFDSAQIQAVKFALDAAIPKQSQKMVDLKLVIDLIFSRFYIVVMVGKDRRKKKRKYVPETVSKLGNIMVATFLLLSVNLFISIFLFMFVYLLKSAFGIDILPGHTGDNLKILM
jgi:hypothetical protein